jgi:hypothetical protein
MELENNKKIISVIVVIAIAFIFARIFSFDTNTEKIKHIIHSAKTATEKEDLLKCISYISLDYSDTEGNNRANLFLIGRNVFAAYDGIIIIFEDLKINIVSGSKAMAHILASGQGRRVTKGKLEYITDWQKAEFEVFLRKEGNSWKVVELKFINPEDFWQLLKGSL